MEDKWWCDAVVYQVYLRSFADADGDGIGDLAGLRAHLPHLVELGVDALWLNPCYPSPQRDHGYDIADYSAIDPVYGTLHDLEQLVTEAHILGIKVLMDMVANHCSDQHPWFEHALHSNRGSVERERFLFRDGRGLTGEIPPNNWQSVFGGPAWTRVVDKDGTPGQWYFHSFDRTQPDFNWRADEVAQYFEEVFRFWYDCGIDGFRIDVAHGLVKSAEMADWPGAEDGSGGHNYDMWDQPGVHDIYRRWRTIGDNYQPKRYLVGEIWVQDIERLVPYLSGSELHQAFSFDLLVQPWNAERMTAAIDVALESGQATGGVPAWTLSNHDVHRAVTRYGQQQDLSAPIQTDLIAAARRRGEADVPLGVQRARAAIMMELALPGSVYLYQGEELGLPEVFDLPDDARQDPIWVLSGGALLGRDGCRVPLPWTTEGHSFGFSPQDTAAHPWLPQPTWFSAFVADDQWKNPESMVNLYRQLIIARRSTFGLGEKLIWLEHPGVDVRAFRRGQGVCMVNFGDTPTAVRYDDALTPVVSSTPLKFGNGVLVLPGNSAAWLVIGHVTTASTTTRADGVQQDSSRSQLVPLAI